MKLFVSSLLLSLYLMLLPPTPEKGSRCTCRPSPPGAVVECQAGQIAVCGGSEGVCKGSCHSLNAQLQPLHYSAELLKVITGENVTADELKKESKASKKALEQILKLSGKDKAGKVVFRKKEHVVGIDLSDLAKNKLKAAVVALGATRVFIPRIGVRP